jgi:putative DNA primase/helicase
MTAAHTVERAADDRLVISTFRDRHDTHPEHHITSWNALIKSLTRHLRLVNKHSAKLWSPAKFKPGANRNGQSVEEIGVLVFDLDDGTDSASVDYWLGDLEYVITSSFSHTPVHPKLRVIIRLIEPIPFEEFDGVWRRANQHLLHGHVDPSTRDPSRMYYAPSCPPSAEPVAIVHMGCLLDWRGLPPLPVLKAMPRRTSGVTPDASDSQKRSAAFLAKWERELATMPPNSGRHNRLLELARAAGGLVGGGLISEQDVVDALSAASRTNGLEAEDGEASVRKTLMDGLENGQATPWVPDDLPDSPTWRQSRRFQRTGRGLVDNDTGELITESSDQANQDLAPSAAAAEDWPLPAAIDGPGPAPALPLECFPTELVRHAEDVADRWQCPVDFVVWTLLVTIATVIGRGVGIRPKAHDDWTERLALWVALIGDPSRMKTPAMNAGVRLLHALTHQLRQEHGVAMDTWRAECAAARQLDGKRADLPAEPELKWLVVDDATTEKLALLVQPEISRGLAFVRDEVSGLIRELERYRTRAGDREFMLQGYSGGPKSYARMSRLTVFVPDLLFNIVGGIQPDVARDVFATGADDGLGERFLAIWPDLAAAYQDVDRQPDRAKRDAFDEVAKRLYVADWAKLLTTDDFSAVPYCRVTPEAHGVFSAWRSMTIQSTRGESPQYEHRFGRRVGKYPGLAARIALVVHLFEQVASPSAHEARRGIGVIDAELIARITRLMDVYVLPMERRVYAAYAVAPEARAARRIARWIRENGQPGSLAGRSAATNGPALTI